MAVKRKKQKKAFSQWLNANAVKIKCCYCDIREGCRYRPDKEAREAKGIICLCANTPNRPKSFKSAKPRF